MQTPHGAWFVSLASVENKEGYQDKQIRTVLLGGRTDVSYRSQTPLR